jgi:hypothetical protein
VYSLGATELNLAWCALGSGGSFTDPVDSFSVRDDAGQVWNVRAASDFNAGAAHVMTPGHMRQHMALCDPVTITYRAEGSSLIALSATD